MFIGPRRQRGLTLWQWVGTIAVLLFFVWIVLTVYPMLFNHYKVWTHLREIARDPATEKMTEDQIKSALEKRFIIDNVDFVNAKKDIKVVRDRKTGKRMITVPYEVKSHFWWKIYIVGDFLDTTQEID